MSLELKQLNLSRTYTADEFEELPEFDDKFYELLEGMLVQKMPPGDEHGWVSRIILKEIALFDPKDKLGAMWPGTSVRLSPSNVPVPDLLYIVAHRIPKTRSKKALNVIPDLVVEVHSPHDLASVKRREEAQLRIRLFQTVGVKVIWAVNPGNQTVEVYHPGQLEPVVLTKEDELDGEDIIPGFKLKVSALFT